ncbi:hypothetical protein NFC81_09055 [Salinispirillum sp. LH 10-3-1]|uniref:Uncharacterized protein n=1 Tax=Salinispirillum sp. LH 10-3-1 TaxID=2952525 RepID=A0AB38YCS0_9GAMM
MRLLKPACIDDFLPLIYYGAETIQARSPEPWTTKEVIKACRKQQAFLFVAPDGFVVLQPKVTDGIKKVHVWLAYGRVKDAAVKSDYINQLKALARQIGACSLTFSSHRRGYKRYLPEAKQTGKNYEISL